MSYVKPMDPWKKSLRELPKNGPVLGAEGVWSCPGR